MMNLRFELLYSVREDRWRVVSDSGHYRECKAIHEIPEALTRMMVDAATALAAAARGVKIERALEVATSAQAAAAGNKPGWAVEAETKP